MEHSIRIEREIDRVRRESPLLRRKEAIEILAMVNHDVHQSSAFSAFWVLRVPGAQTQNSQTPLVTQVMTGGNTGIGQEGVLDLRSMEWTPVERNDRARVGHELSRGLETLQQSANANGTGSHQGANIQAFGTLSRTLRAREGRQEEELRLDRAVLERIAQRTLEEMARRGQ